MGKPGLNHKLLNQLAARYHLDLSKLEARLKKVQEERAKGPASYDAWVKQQKEQSEEKTRRFNEKAVKELVEKLSYRSKYRFLARVFWTNRLQRNRISTMSLEDEKSSPENYCARIVDLINGKPAYFDTTKYCREVKPYLDREKVFACFSDIRIPKDQVYLIIMLLKPFPFTSEFTNGHPELAKLIKSTCDEIDPLARKYSLIAQQLKRIPPYPYWGLLRSVNLHEIASKIKNLACLYDSIVKFGREIPKMHYKYYGIWPSKYKRPQQHPFWKYAVKGAYHEIHKYCHTDNCGGTIGKPCRTDHIEAYRIIARLLQILYPRIWREDIAIITGRIKTKSYQFSAN